MNVVQAVIRQASARPKAPALITAHGTISYGELMATVVQLASRMSQLGVRRGDVVGILVPGSVPHISLTLAVAYVGGVSVPLGAAKSAEDRASAAELCGVKFFFHTDAESSTIELPNVSVQMGLRELLDKSIKLEPVPIARVEPQDTWRIAFTSGTSGRPKAMKLGHEATILKTQMHGAVLPMRPDDRVLVEMSVGLGFSVTYWMRALSTGAAVVAYQGDSIKAWDALHRHEVTWMVSSPGNAMGIVAVARAPGSAGVPSKLRKLVLGGAPVTQTQRELLRRHLCDDLVINYGATEAGMIALLGPKLMDRDPACAGRLVNWQEVEAVDADGRPIPPGTGEGLLRMRSATMASGYILPADASPDDQQAFRDGWFYSKDVGRIAPDGRIYLSGRAGDVINLGGVKIDPGRVEEVMARDPSVLECALVGVNAPNGMLTPVAVIVPQGELDWPRLRRACQQALPEIAVPRRFVTMESLPRNAGGKVMRGQLIEMVQSADAWGPK